MRLKTVAFLPASWKQHFILTQRCSHYWNVYRTWSVTCVYQFYCKNFFFKKNILQPHTYKTKINTKKPHTVNHQGTESTMATVHIPVIPYLAPILQIAFFLSSCINRSILLPPFKKIFRLVHWAVEVKSQMTSDDSRISPDITGMCVLVFYCQTSVQSLFLQLGCVMWDVTKSEIIISWSHFSLTRWYSDAERNTEPLHVSLVGDKTFCGFPSSLIKWHY